MLDRSYKEDITAANDNTSHNVTLSTVIRDVFIPSKHNKTIKMYKLESIHIFSILIHGNGFNNILQIDKKAIEP